MKETGIEKRGSFGLKEKGQYATAFGLVGVMLWFVGFPVFLLFFIGVLAFFVWKVFASETRGETRKIFEFYLSANEILRDDERRWYGFEVQEVLNSGELITRSMNPAPPLVHFGVGSLYQKLGDHSSAVKHLAEAIDATTADEITVVFPSKDLREYVRMLRRIERAPAEAPLTSAAVRSLERARKNRGKALLDHSRKQISQKMHDLPKFEQKRESVTNLVEAEAVSAFPERLNATAYTARANGSVTDPEPKSQKQSARDRKTISEVLHDIYDAGPGSGDTLVPTDVASGSGHFLAGGTDDEDKSVLAPAARKLTSGQKTS